MHRDIFNANTFRQSFQNMHTVRMESCDKNPGGAGCVAWHSSHQVPLSPMRQSEPRRTCHSGKRRRRGRFFVHVPSHQAYACQAVVRCSILGIWSARIARLQDFAIRAVVAMTCRRVPPVRPAMLAIRSKAMVDNTAQNDTLSSSNWDEDEVDKYRKTRNPYYCNTNHPEDIRSIIRLRVEKIENIDGTPRTSLSYGQRAQNRYSDITEVLCDNGYHAWIAGFIFEFE
nr:hypothetical protein CFP56_13432 [Quercus suber]